MRTRYEMSRKRKGILLRKQNALRAVFLLCMMAGAIAAIYIGYTIHSPSIYKGIRISGVEVGGMNPAEAFDILQRKNQRQMDNMFIELQNEDMKWIINGRDIGARLDIEEKVNEAYRLGRRGNFIIRFLGIRRLEREGFELNLNIVYDEALLKSQIDEIADEVNEDMKDAFIDFPTGKEQKVIIVPEKEGKALDQDLLMEEINRGLQSESQLSIALPMKPILPKVSGEELQKLTHMISSFSTNLGNSNEDRRHNVFLAAKSINGFRVMPGEVFSFNKATGERTIERGYRNAAVITKDKRLEDEPGGGICQTSTTLYNAVLLAGMEITERAHHSFPVFYAEPGFDATVNYPVTDFKFRNTRDTPIYLVSYESGNNLVVEVYGASLPNGITYKLEKEVYEEIPAPEPEIRQDTKKEYSDRIKYKDEEYVWVESRKGIKVRTYRVTLKEGREIGRHLIADDFYQPIKGITYIGTEERPLRDWFAPHNGNSSDAKEVISLTLDD